MPIFDEAKLASMRASTLPDHAKPAADGYRFLAYAQSATHKILTSLPQLRGDAHDQFYVTITRWLDGADIAGDMGLRA